MINWTFDVLMSKIVNEVKTSMWAKSLKPIFYVKVQFSKPFWALIYYYFLIQQFKHVLWELKRDSSFEYQQHMFWLRNKKKDFQLHTLIWKIEEIKPNVMTWKKNI